MHSKEVLAGAILRLRENLAMNQVKKLTALCVALANLMNAATYLLVALAKVVHEISKVIG